MAKVDEASSLRSTSVIKAALTGRQSLEIILLQVFGDEMVEPVFAFLRREFLNQRGVGDVGRHLAAQGAMADRLEPRLERLECHTQSNLDSGVRVVA
jgi:hypothetical protein